MGSRRRAITTEPGYNRAHTRRWGNRMKLVRARAATAAAAAVIALASAAHATGAGTYAVDGQGPNGANPYHGIAELTQTGQGTWHVHWQIGSEIYDGTGVGDSQA